MKIERDWWRKNAMLLFSYEFLIILIYEPVKWWRYITKRILLIIVYVSQGHLQLIKKSFFTIIETINVENKLF